MLWSLGMIVLIVDICHVLKFGGIDLDYNNMHKWSTRFGKPTELDPKKEHHIHHFGILDLNSSKFSSPSPPVDLSTPASNPTLKLLDINEIAKLFNRHSKPEHNDGTWEKNIHDIIKVKAKETTEDGDDDGDDDEEEEEEDDDNGHQDDAERALHSP